MPSNINGWFIHFIIFFICSIMNIMIINTHKTPERDPRSLDSITHICCRISDTLHSHDHSASMILAFFSHISKYISRNFLGYPRPPFNIGVNHSCSRSKHYPSYIICSTRLSDCRRLESFIFAKRLLDKIESPKSKRSSKVQAYHLLSASLCAWLTTNNILLHNCYHLIRAVQRKNDTKVTFIMHLLETSFTSVTHLRLIHLLYSMWITRLSKCSQRLFRSVDQKANEIPSRLTSSHFFKNHHHHDSRRWWDYTIWWW